MTRKTKSDQEPSNPVIDIEEIAKELMQIYLLRINGQDIVLFGPIMGWPEEKDVEVESIGFGELVKVEDVIEMLHGMRDARGGVSVMSKLQ
jgi:hypothetical protein